MKDAFIFFLLLTIYFILGLGGLYFVHDAFPEPYIDEEFHVPQAQQFCEGNYDDWDPKITTPPGLYAITIFVLTPFTWLSGIEACEIFHLRFVNVLATSVNFLLLLLIKRKLFYRKNNWLSIIEACSLASFPILYFFSFLYYTDAVSTMFVLATYLLYLHDQHFMASIAGLLATCVRQTNIVWVAYVSAIRAYNTLCDTLADGKKPSAKRKKSLKNPFSVIMESLSNPRAIIQVIRKDFWYIVVGAAFVGFLLWNGSIVMGDKTAHEATLHLPQLFYFSACMAAFSPMLFINFIPRFLQIVRKQKLQVFTMLLAALLAVHLNTLTHPYLLADNRHYTFYIWKRIFEAHWWARYALCPLYVYCLLCINENLKPQGTFNRYLTFCCIVAVIIPQQLLEPRYFIMPYLITKLNINVRSRSTALVELAIAVLVNLATIYIYIACPFATDECVRFIW